MKDSKKLALTALLAAAMAPLHGVQISEIRIDQPGNPDDEEFVELRGTPGESLDDVWFLYIGDHSGTGLDVLNKRSGVVEIALNLSGYSIPADGHFLMLGTAFDGNAFGLDVSQVDYVFEGFGNALENSDNVTALLVRGWSGNGGNEVRGIDDQLGAAAVDIDDDDDGVPNTTLPWSSIVDAVGLFESPTSGEWCYGAALGFVDVGPDRLVYVPSHIWRGNNDGAWNIGTYDVFELDANQNVLGIFPDAKDSPGVPNPNSPAPVMTPSISALSTIFVGEGETIVVTGDNLDTTTAVTIGTLAASFSYNSGDGSLSVTVPAGATTSHLTVTNTEGEATSVNLIVVIDRSDSFEVLEDFSGGIGEANTYSVASNRNWQASSFGDAYSIEINGYGADVASDDWLISPAINLDELTGTYLIMGHERVFNGPALEVKISTDYSGTGDPNAATWTNLNIVLAGDNADEIVDSGKTDISAWDGQTIYLAVRYTTAGTGPGEGAIDRIHYVVIGGEALGWKDTTDYGWLYYYTPQWGFSMELGFIYVANFPWIYNTNFGYMLHVARAQGIGFWLYSPVQGWIFCAEGAGGWFQSSANGWAYNNFISPIPG